MKTGSRKMKSFKRKLRTRMSSRSLAGGRRTRHRRYRRRSQRGGYSQYQNNMPLTQNYQVAGINLPSSQLALANPPPITVLPRVGQCTDNYNHYTNMGFPSRGH